MIKTFSDILNGYHAFRDKYVHGDNAILQYLANYGQQPQAMVVACCDSRVDPALILQCDPGDLFVVRNVANIIPPYEKDAMHHGTSAALEFGVCYLKVQNLVILGHSNCGGINALLNPENLSQNDFISSWVSLINTPRNCQHDADECARQSLIQSYHHCLTFPWIKERLEQNNLAIHLWYFDIEKGEILTYSHQKKLFEPLE